MREVVPLTPELVGLQYARSTSIPVVENGIHTSHKIMIHRTGRPELPVKMALLTYTMKFALRAS